MRLLKLSTARDILVFMADSTDHVTGKTGLTLTITAGKAGAAFASITPTVTERGNGWYTLGLTASHTDTLGDLAFHITGSGADPSDFVCQVVAFDFGDAAGLGLSRLDAAVSSRATAADVPTAAANADQVWDEILSGHAVSGSTGAALSAIKAKTDTIGALSVTVTAPVANDGTLTIVQGDDYLSADGASLDFTFTGLTYSLVGATPVKLSLRNRLTGTVTSITGSVLGASSVRFEPTAAVTDLLTVGEYDYDIQATLANAHIRTPLRGRGQVLADYTP